MLKQMINAPGYKSGATEVLGNYTFKADGASRSFDLYVKNTNDNDSTYVIIERFRD